MMEKKPLRRADFITSVILVVFGIWMAIHTVTNFPMKDTYAGVQSVWYVSPALFPLLISTGLVLLGVLLLVNSIKEGGAKTFFEGLAHIKPGISENLLRFLAIVLVLVAYVYLDIPRIDFFLSSLLCLTVFITMYYLDYSGILKRLTVFYAVGSLIFVLLFVVGVDKWLNKVVTDAFVNKLIFTFQNEAFISGKASNVKDSEYYMYLNLTDPTLLYNDNRFKEADANDGSIDQSKPIIITVSGDTLAGENGEDFVASGKVKTNIDKVASGLTPVITRTSSTELEVIVTGNATKHMNAHDVSGLIFTFQDTAFTSVKARTFANYQKEDLRINFKDPSMAYSAKAFTEAPANDGSIDNSTPLIITLNGDTLTGEDGEDFVVAGKVQTNVTRIAPGLKMVMTRTSPTELQVTLVGIAEEHADENDVKELMIKFKDKAFMTAKTKRVEYAHKTDMKIDFADSRLIYSGTGFQEAAANDGSIDKGEPLTITISGATLNGTDGEDFVATGKVQTNLEQMAPGLKAVVTRTKATELEVMLTGNAADHADTSDVDKLTFTFKDTAFALGKAESIIDASKSDVQIDFIEQALTYAETTFKEADADDGSIKNALTLTLNADTFTGADGENFVETGKVVTNIAEVIPGLTAVVTRMSETELQVGLTGNAMQHASVNNVTDLMLAFQDTAFTSGNAGDVVNSSKNDLQISFSDPRLIYLKKRFKEADANDGSIDNSDPMKIKVTGDTFGGEDGEDFVSTGKVATNIENIAPGLQAVVARTSPTELEAMLIGNATKHQKVHETENLTFTFQDGAFTSSNAASVDHSTTEDLRINFSNPVLTYSAKAFLEAGNDGSIDNETPVTVVLTGDTLTGEDGEDFVATGKVKTNIQDIAQGLQAVFTRKSPTVLEITLLGNANKHANANDVRKLGFIFQDTAFTLGDANIVVNAAKEKLQIDFNDQALKFSKKGFKEAAANDGTIENGKPLVITLTGDRFTGEDGEDFAAAGKLKTNFDDMAAGLTPVVIRTSPTELKVMLMDSAEQHANTNDVFIKGAFRYSMDILLFIFFLLYVWYCWRCVQKLGEEEAKAKFLLGFVVSIAVPIFIIPLFKYALLVPFPVEGGAMELMNLFWYSPAIRVLRKVLGRYLLLLGIDLIFVAIIGAIYFKFMRKATKSTA